MGLFSTKKNVGLDIGSKSIKIVALNNKGSRYELIDWQIVELPEEIVSIETPLEKRNLTITEVIKDIFLKNKKLSKKVGISVAGPSVVIRYIKLPIMTKEELSKSISLEVEPFIPFPLSDVYLGFDIIGEVIDEGIKKNEIVIVAAKKELIDSRLDLLKQLKLTPRFIDVDSFVLERVVGYNYDISNEVVCVINIGANVTNVNIIENGTTKICRDLSLGMYYIINEIKKTTQLSPKDIVNYFKTDGLILTDQKKEEYILQDKKLELNISKIISSLLKEFVAEIRKIMDFYYFQKGEQKPISRIFLNGGVCIINDVDVYFNNEFKINVEILDPFKNVDNSEDVPKEVRPILSVAVGLAMRYK
ncbi:MAG: type IV pilus assembly protein PilM [Endomicrobia bacterium]|nr:type IV pilus assembly protein PilM [Endomicrobiia bacterium]